MKKNFNLGAQSLQKRGMKMNLMLKKSLIIQNYTKYNPPRLYFVALHPIHNKEPIVFGCRGIKMKILD